MMPMEGPVKSALGILLACCRCAFALDPSLDVNQYGHKSWTVHDGFFKSGIQSIAQTADGYLWLGTEFGLLRFDGVQAVPWSPPAGEQLSSDDIVSLLGGRDGRLWIGTRDGLASWKDGKLTHYRELNGKDVFALLEDRKGTVWVAAYGEPIGGPVRRPKCHGRLLQRGWGLRAGSRRVARRQGRQSLGWRADRAVAMAARGRRWKSASKQPNASFSKTRR